MLRCSNCGSRFFKVLEYRLEVKDTQELSKPEGALLSKRRCKRCKFKSFFQKDFHSRKVRPVSIESWQNAVKLGRRYSHQIGTRQKVYVGEYTHKISRPAEIAAEYLNQLNTV